MKKFIIEPTHCSPRVELDPAGEVMICGRSIMEDPETFYRPMFKWIKMCSMDHLHITFKLEYTNTDSSKLMHDFLALLVTNRSIRNINVSWYYDEGDDEALEMGKDFELLLKCPFEFHSNVESLV